MDGSHLSLNGARTFLATFPALVSMRNKECCGICVIRKKYVEYNYNRQCASVDADARGVGQ